MKISAVSSVLNVNKSSSLKQKPVSFGEMEWIGGYGFSHSLRGDKFDLSITRVDKNIFDITNRSKSGKCSRFLLNPKDEKYSDLVIIAKPDSRIYSSFPYFDIGMEYSYRNVDKKTKDFTTEPFDDLKSSRRLFSDLNPKKEILENPRMHVDKNGNVTFDRNSRRLFRRFVAENNLDVSNVIVYTKK